MEVSDESNTRGGFRVGKDIAKRGVPYGQLVTLTDSEIQQELERLEREIPGVHFLEWSPRDEDGNIRFYQDMCQTQALSRHRTLWTGCCSLILTSL